eukprot:TRINITY_DN50994_c0_g1_i3.p1 TRINITY_DN50994_c0_g1~~TRINITY_DN50994_c0_g1_i3.p1  ORF type:complete len:521 (+),score=93.63 TRINITY_DN50994_c0_g1_i3:130-1692(+)
MLRSLVGSEMCIRDSLGTHSHQQQSSSHYNGRGSPEGGGADGASPSSSPPSNTSTARLPPPPPVWYKAIPWGKVEELHVHGGFTSESGPQPSFVLKQKQQQQQGVGGSNSKVPSSSGTQYRRGSMNAVDNNSNMNVSGRGGIHHLRSTSSGHPLHHTHHHHTQHVSQHSRHSSTSSTRSHTPSHHHPHDSTSNDGHVRIASDTSSGGRNNNNNNKIILPQQPKRTSSSSSALHNRNGGTPPPLVSPTASNTGATSTRPPLAGGFRNAAASSATSRPPLQQQHQQLPTKTNTTTTNQAKKSQQSSRQHQQPTVMRDYAEVNIDIHKVSASVTPALGITIFHLLKNLFMESSGSIEPADLFGIADQLRGSGEMNFKAALDSFMKRSSSTDAASGTTTTTTSSLGSHPPPLFGVETQLGISFTFPDVVVCAGYDPVAHCHVVPLSKTQLTHPYVLAMEEAALFAATTGAGAPNNNSNNRHRRHTSNSSAVDFMLGSSEFVDRRPCTYLPVSYTHLTLPTKRIV